MTTTDDEARFDTFAYAAATGAEDSYTYHDDGDFEHDAALLAAERERQRDDETLEDAQQEPDSLEHQALLVNRQLGAEVVNLLTNAQVLQSFNSNQASAAAAAVEASAIGAASSSAPAPSGDDAELPMQDLREYIDDATLHAVWLEAIGTTVDFTTQQSDKLLAERDDEEIQHRFGLCISRCEQYLIIRHGQNWRDKLSPACKEKWPVDNNRK